MTDRIDMEAHRRLDAHDSLLRDHDDMFNDFKAWAWGNPARKVKGIEERTQEVEAVVRLVRFYGPVAVGLLAVIAAGQWPALAALLNLLF